MVDSVVIIVVVVHVRKPFFGDAGYPLGLNHETTRQSKRYVRGGGGDATRLSKVLFASR